MSNTTTVIDRLPADYRSEDQYGDGWESDGINPVEVFLECFDEWLEENYGFLTRCGGEIIGPAEMRFPHCIREDLYDEEAMNAELPEDGLWAEFNEIHCDDWCDLIIKYAGRN